MTSRHELKRVEKSTTVERYDLWFKPMGYAFLIVDSKNGFFSGQTDWGDYHHMWDSPGGDFKAFLARLNYGYLMDKLVGSPKLFDREKTFKNIKERIVKERRTGVLDYTMASEYWDLVEEAPRFDTLEAFQYWFWEQDEMTQLFPDPEDNPGELRHRAQDEYFCKEIFPVFQEILRKEIEDAKNGTQQSLDDEGRREDQDQGHDGRSPDPHAEVLGALPE
jgi:hypothetical protein